MPCELLPRRSRCESERGLQIFSSMGLWRNPVDASGSEPDPKGWRFESSQAHQILRVEGEVILPGS